MSEAFDADDEPIVLGGYYRHEVRGVTGFAIEIDDVGQVALSPNRGTKFNSWRLKRVRL